MLLNEIQTLLMQAFPDAQVAVESNGNHFDLRIVSVAFAGLLPVKKQQLVYAAIADKIADGSMHAVNMKLFTPEQWAKQQA